MYMCDIESNYNKRLTNFDVLELFEQACLNNSQTKIDYFLNNFMIDGKLLNPEIYVMMYNKSNLKICKLWISLGFRPKHFEPLYDYWESFYTIKTIA